MESMKKKIIALAIGIFAMTSNTMLAADFLDTNASGSTITAGLRFGINSSNQKGTLRGYSDNASFNWRTGFTVGGVINLNVRNYFSVQPGFFFENRSFDYTVVRLDNASQLLQNDLGHTRSYSFNIPVLASFHFNLTDGLQWNVEAGPYFQFGIGGNDEIEQIHSQVSAQPNGQGTYIYTKSDRDFYGGGQWQHRKFDWGFKFGTGLRLYHHYVIAVYYLAGCKNSSAIPEWKMRNKSWNFSIGYDF